MMPSSLNDFAAQCAATCALLPWLPGLRNKPNLALVFIYHNPSAPHYKGWYFLKNQKEPKLYSLAHALNDAQRAEEGALNLRPILHQLHALQNMFTDPKGASSEELHAWLQAFPLHFKTTEYSNSYHYESEKKFFKSIHCPLPEALHFVQQHDLFNPKRSNFFTQIIEHIATNTKLTSTLKSQWEARLLEAHTPLAPARLHTKKL